jgi:hypothetical protein
LEKQAAHRTGKSAGAVVAVSVCGFGAEKTFYSEGLAKSWKLEAAQGNCDKCAAHRICDNSGPEDLPFLFAGRSSTGQPWRAFQPG